MLKITLSFTLISMLALPLAACNTMEGLGKDTSAAGQAITNAAQKTQGN